jgi:hypothetical protein
MPNATNTPVNSLQRGCSTCKAIKLDNGQTTSS